MIEVTYPTDAGVIRRGQIEKAESMELVERLVEIETKPEFELLRLRDGYDPMRSKIKHLLATVKAMLARMPQSES